MLFLVGVILGTFFVYAVLFRNRDLPAWTPNGRVLQALKSAPVKMDNRVRCILDCHQVKDEDIILLINDGKVLFSESSIRDREIPEYVVRGKGSDGKVLKVIFRSVPNFTEIIDVKDGRISKPECEC
ncbi:MAG: DUF4258 domain-containing protein [Flavobacteriales bacterium]